MGGEKEFEPPDQRSGKPPEELAEVGTGGGEHGVDGIAGQSCQEAAVHPMIALQVSDFRFDRAAASSALSLGT